MIYYTFIDNILFSHLDLPYFCPWDDRTVTVCLHTHKLTTGVFGWAARAGPRKTGRPEEALPQAPATASLSVLQWPRNLHNTYCYSRLRSSHTEGKRERDNATEDAEGEIE